MSSAHSSAWGSKAALYIFIRMELSYITHMCIASMRCSSMFVQEMQVQQSEDLCKSSFGHKSSSSRGRWWFLSVLFVIKIKFKKLLLNNRHHTGFCLTEWHIKGGFKLINLSINTTLFLWEGVEPRRTMWSHKVRVLNYHVCIFVCALFVYALFMWVK